MGTKIIVVSLFAKFIVSFIYLRCLREAYSEFDTKDKVISKMTVHGRIKEKDKIDWKKIGAVAGIIAIGTVGAVADGIHSAGKKSF